jgi:hypothetical protein
MRRYVVQGYSIEQAAKMVVDRAEGKNSTEASKLRRLRKHYNRKYD